MYVRMVVSRCFAALRHSDNFDWRYVSNECLKSLVVALIHSRLDYSNFILVGLPEYRQRILKLVLNAAARMR